MPTQFQTYRPGLASDQDVVLRVVKDGDSVKAFVRRMDEDADTTPVYPTEEVAVQDAIRLAESRAGEDKPILVQLEDGVQWDAAWGDLRD